LKNVTPWEIKKKITTEVWVGMEKNYQILNQATRWSKRKRTVKRKEKKTKRAEEKGVIK